MLRIGPVYDEEWFVFFGNQSSDKTSSKSSDKSSYTSSRQSEDGIELWADLRTLKKILKNEGVQFDAAHNKYPLGAVDPSLKRLCNVYDKRLKLWSATMLVRTPPNALMRLMASAKAEEQDRMNSPTYDDDFSDDEVYEDVELVEEAETDRASYRAGSLTDEAIEPTEEAEMDRASHGDGSSTDEAIESIGKTSAKCPPSSDGSVTEEDAGPVEKEQPSFARPHLVHRVSGIAVNIGQRFSEDFESRRKSWDDSDDESLFDDDEVGEVLPSSHTQPPVVRPYPDATTRKEVHNDRPGFDVQMEFIHPLERGGLTGKQRAAVLKVPADPNKSNTEHAILRGLHARCRLWQPK